MKLTPTTIPPRPALVLTDDNYYSLDADRAWMSFHQLRNWRECAAKEKARQAGEYVAPDQTALLVGQYVHTALLEPDKLEAFTRDNGAALFTKAGGLKAEYKTADACIARLQRDSDAMVLLRGHGGASEEIVTAHLEGCWWKAKMDRVYRSCRMVVDLKTARDFEPAWGEAAKAKLPWWKVYSYDAQMAVYCRMLRTAELEAGAPDEVPEWTPVLVGVSKQDPPDIAGVEISDRVTLSMGYSAGVAGLAETLEIKAGRADAWRCETCDYCRATKKLKIARV